MLWLKARSVVALGMTTATRKGSAAAGASVASAGASVAILGASVGGVVPQALSTTVKARIRLKNHTNFFIFFSLLDEYNSFDGIFDSISKFILQGCQIHLLS